MPTRFRSKVDWWLGVILIALPLVLAGSALSGWKRGSPVGLAPLGAVILIYVVFLLPLHYDLAEDALVIRHGLMRWRVPYRDILRVVPTRNPISSPALSLDRLHIDAGNPAGPNISPADRAGFLRALADRCPHLTLRDGSLVPASPVPGPRA